MAETYKNRALTALSPQIILHGKKNAPKADWVGGMNKGGGNNHGVGIATGQVTKARNGIADGYIKTGYIGLQGKTNLTDEFKLVVRANLSMTGLSNHPPLRFNRASEDGKYKEVIREISDPNNPAQFLYIYNYATPDDNKTEIKIDEYSYGYSLVVVPPPPQV